MGHTPTKFGETGWGVSHTETKEVDWVRREKHWRAKKNKKMEKKNNGQKKKKNFFFWKKSHVGTQTSSLSRRSQRPPFGP